MDIVKRLLCVVLVIVLLISACPIRLQAAAAETDTTITVASVNAKPGDTVHVAVRIAGNPGIMGATLMLNYDPKLTLTEAEGGDAFSALTMTKPGSFASGCKFVWDAQDITSEGIKNGEILDLTFQVAADAAADQVMEISVSYTEGDVFDASFVAVPLTLVSGGVTIAAYLSGDLNEDGVVNTKDVVMMRRAIAGGYNLTINEAAADVNADGTLNTKDVVVLRRYIAGGYGIDSLPTGGGTSTPDPKPDTGCTHTDLKAVAEKAPSCEETGSKAYWQCNGCGKYFSDEKAQTEVTLASLTLEATGHTGVAYQPAGHSAGSKCKVCGKILVEPVPIPDEHYEIVYHVAEGDTYLENLHLQGKIPNENPVSYVATDKITLRNLTVPGYRFVGWFDTASTANAEPIKKIENQTGRLDLYAHWEKVEYTITFDSPDVEWKSITYTVDKGATLTNPSWFGYTFVGWSDDNGFIISRVKPGTTGNMTLHANWTSNRNKATSYTNYGEPIIIEDDVNGQFLFIYNIGKIDNVPLNEISHIGNTQKLEINDTYKVSNYISTESADTIANTVSNATTRSSGWTLSEKWNDVYTGEKQVGSSSTLTDERTDSQGNVVGGNYFISNSTGGSSFVSNESGGSHATSSKVTTENSTGINETYDRETEKYADVKLGVTNEATVEAGVSLPVDIVEVSAGVKNTTTVSAEASSGRRDKDAYHIDRQASSYVGTVDTNNQTAHFNTIVNQSSTWNSTSGYEKSYQTSHDTTITSAVSEQIMEKSTHSVSKALGGESSQTGNVENENVKTDEYSSTLKFSEGSEASTDKKITFSSDRPGYYRLVMAGTVHVYGVVGYDVATASYYSYTFSVMDDKTYEYLDYSKDNANFNDCENGVVTFQVPYDINEYVCAVTGQTPGLEFSLDGEITAFTPAEGFDGTVVIPQYYSVDNGDGTFSAFRTTGISPDAFSGNTEIKTVVLPLYVTEIPDEAFADCTSLENVYALGITKIGDSAFRNCTSLKPFALDNMITELGKKAFENCAELTVNAASEKIAEAAINSGARKITVNLADMEGSFDDKEIIITDATEFFAFQGGGKTFRNLRIQSDAAQTVVNNVVFEGNVSCPMELDSEKVTLNRVTVKDSPGFALILKAENTELSLYGIVDLDSSGENTAISRNVTLKKEKANVQSMLQVSGTYMCCGTITNPTLLKGATQLLTEKEYENMLTSSIVTFDANGGTVDQSSVVVYYGQTYGQLPVPTREYHTFNGWFTSQEGGTQVTADTKVESTENQTLYAQWTKNTFTLTFDANGGTVEETSRLVSCGVELGELPVPVREGYRFEGWYTPDDEQLTQNSQFADAVDVTAAAKWTLITYHANWDSSNTYDVAVTRTASPNGNAGTGVLESGAEVFYGDELTVTYTARAGYSLESQGAATVTVTGDVTADTIFATTVANTYTLTFVYKSTNGTYLGEQKVTHAYNTSEVYTLNHTAYPGYVTPGGEVRIGWITEDTTEERTYAPADVSTSQGVASGSWWYYNGATRLGYNVAVEYQNRTADNVQMRVVWTNTMGKYHYYGYTQSFNASLGGVGTGDITIAKASLWNSAVNYDRSQTAYSGWVTVPLNTTNQTTVSVSGGYWSAVTSGNWSGTVTVPAY